MIYLLDILVAFVVLDGLLTRFLIDGKLAREGNPLLEGIVGEDIFMILKIAGALVCALILWDVYKRYPRLSRIVTWCGVIFYGGIILWNSSFILLA